MTDEYQKNRDEFKKRFAKPAKPLDAVPNPVVQTITDNHPLHKQPKVERENELMNTEEGGWLQGVCDVLSTGNFMTANLALENARGRVRTPWDIAGAIWEGATHKKKTSWIDVVNEIAPGAHPYVKTGLGLTGDIIIDPVNLIPAGAFAKVGKLLKIPQALNIVGDIPMVSSVLDAVKPGRQLSKVKPLAKDFKFENAYRHKRDLELQIANFRREMLGEIKERSNLFHKVAKSIGMEPKTASALMTKQHQAGLSDEILPEFKPFYDDIAEGFKEIHKAEVGAGLMKNETFRKNYFPGIYEKGRLIVKDGETILGKADGYFSKMSWKNQVPFSQGKTWETVEIAKQELAKIQAKGIATDIIPVEDWFQGYATRKFVSDSAVAWKGYIDEAVDNFATPMSKQLGEANATALKKFVDADDMESARRLIGSIQLEKGVSFVTKTTNLRSPKMQSFVLKQTKEALQQSDEATAMTSLTNLFKHTGGKGLVDVSVDDVLKMGIDDVYLMPNEISKSVKNAFKPFTSDESVSKFWKFFDSATHIWKTMATAMRVAFHSRNATTNMWQMYLSGVDPSKMVQRIAAAGRVQLDSKSVLVNGFTAKDLNKMGDRYGFKAYGMMGSDMPQQFQKQLHLATSGKKFSQWLGTESKNPYSMYAQAGRKVGSGIEDNARLAVMIDQIKKTGLKKASPGELAELKKAEDTLAATMKSVKPGLTESHPMIKKLSEKVTKMREVVNRTREFSKIADHVKKYLFDYTEVTGFEKEIMGRAQPFYKWLRKNIPVQISSMVDNPARYAKLGDWYNDLWPDTVKTATEEAVMPGWMRDGGFKKLNFVGAKGDPIYYKVDLPMMDLQNMMGLENYMTSLHPVLALALTASNVKLWPKGDVIAKPGELAEAPMWAGFLSSDMQKMCGMEPRHTSTGVRLGMDPHWKHALGITFPFLKQWEIAYPDKDGKLAMKDDLKWKLLSDVSGVQFKPFDVKQAKKSEVYGRQETKRRIKATMKQRQRALTKKEIKKIKKEVMGK